MRTKGILGAVVGLMLTTAAYGETEWTKFTSEKDGFSVEFPCSPALESADEMLRWWSCQTTDGAYSVTVMVNSPMTAADYTRGMVARAPMETHAKVDARLWGTVSVDNREGTVVVIRINEGKPASSLSVDGADRTMYAFSTPGEPDETSAVHFRNSIRFLKH